MKEYLLLLLFAVVGAVKARNSVIGIIRDSRNWFLSDLSVRPAMRATIEYDIWYPYLEHYEDPQYLYPRPIITFYYTGQNSPNLGFQCNEEMYGQLDNKDLAILLNEDKRENKPFCKLLIPSTTFVNSRGRIEIQDFEPKTYFFSLGFECGYQKNLDCFQYNVTIYDESNTTKCLDLNMTSKYSDMSQQSLIDQCEISYQYAAIPNQFGDTDLDGAISRMKRISDAGLLSTIFLRKRRESDDAREHFLKNPKPFLCEIVLPKCLPEENKIILPCRDDCEFYLDGCLWEFMNCNYLPPCEGRNSVIGSIKDNTTWFLSNLSVRPAMLVSIRYNIQYPYDGPVPVLTFYYNGQNSSNLQRRCNAEMHGQLFNIDLAIPLRGRYREKFWCNYKYGGIRDCYGGIKIQDFEPKSYSFSLGFKCNGRKGNLKGLKYDVTIYDESNKTSCLAVNMKELQGIDPCHRSHQNFAFPSPAGETDPAMSLALENFLNNMSSAVGNQTKYEAHLKSWNKCLKVLKPFLCDIVLPQCLPEKNKILLPCRDTCKSINEDCPIFIFPQDKFPFGMDINCDYLPPCPPTYPNYLIIGLSVGACVILVVMVTACCVIYWKRISDACLTCLFKQLIALRNRMKWRADTTDGPLVPRNRAFDACVLYHFDRDDIYVLDTILPELEENRNFNLYIHNRNFTPGRDIKDNIEAAIEGSNSAILLMSQGFVDSIWCKEEFTHCYIENMKDAAFNLFVIMMQPADTLVNISSYMKTFFETKTYLDVNDPELFTEIAALLDEARKPVKDDVDNHNNDDNDKNIDSDDETPREYNLLCHPDEILQAQETSV